MIQATPLDRIMDLARAIGGNDDDRRRRGLDRAQLGDSHLIFGQNLEQIRLEGLVGPVELVDQQYRRNAVVRLQRLQNRPADQEPLAENIGGQRLAIDLALRFGQPDLDHLPRIIPLVYRRRGVETFVALQAHQRARKRNAKHLGDFGLADARLAFEEKRPAHLEREKHAGREPPVREVVVTLEQRDNGIDTIGQQGGRHVANRRQSELDYNVMRSGSARTARASAH